MKRSTHKCAAWLIVLVALFLVFLLACAAPTPAPEAPADLEDFSGDLYTISVPSGWKVKSRNGAWSWQFFTGPNDNTYIHVGSYHHNPPGQPADGENLASPAGFALHTVRHAKENSVPGTFRLRSRLNLQNDAVMVMFSYQKDGQCPSEHIGLFREYEEIIFSVHGQACTEDWGKYGPLLIESVESFVFRPKPKW